jgi:hypothetical protein
MGMASTTIAAEESSALSVNVTSWPSAVTDSRRDQMPVESRAGNSLSRV